MEYGGKGYSASRSGDGHRYRLQYPVSTEERQADGGGEGGVFRGRQNETFTISLNQSAARRRITPAPTPASVRTKAAPPPTAAPIAAAYPHSQTAPQTAPPAATHPASNTAARSST